MTFDENQYCIRRNVSPAENSLYHNHLEGIRNDSCINITIPPTTNTRDNELWQNMGLLVQARCLEALSPLTRSAPFLTPFFVRSMKRGRNGQRTEEERRKNGGDYAPDRAFGRRDGL